ncbi:MAG: hypothetical protein IJT34_01055 [Butyrivibrio sp.]|nr:hypothetical protein [Butyrivibrio sp.]
MAETIDLSGWFFATENYNDDLQADIMLLRVATSYFSTSRHEEILSVYEGTHSQFYLIREESRRVSEELIRRFMTDASWRRELLPSILEASEQLEAVYGDDDLPVEALSTEDLLALYNRQNQAREDLLLASWRIEEMHSSVNSIEDRLLALVGGDKQVYADLLWTPVLSAFSEEKKRLQEGDDPVKLWQKYRYSGYHGYTNPHVKTLEEYQAEASGKEWQADPEAERRYREAASHFPEETLDIFRCYANLGVAKSYRRLAELKNFYYLERMIREMSGRFQVPETAIRFMLPEEIPALATTGAYDPERAVAMVYYGKSGKETIYTGEACRQIMDRLPQEQEPTTITGMIACRGVAVGRAVVVRKNGEADGFRPGDILVSNEPNPEMFEIMRTASAVVTDQGGITCHAASIARELGIPCVTGTQNATKLIHTGDMIVVDANIGEVTIK